MLVRRLLAACVAGELSAVLAELLSGEPHHTGRDRRRVLGQEGAEHPHRVPTAPPGSAGLPDSAWPGLALGLRSPGGRTAPARPVTAQRRTGRSAPVLQAGTQLACRGPHD